MEQYKKYLSFDGRATRSEYWAVNLITYLGLILVGLVSVLITMSGLFGAIVAGLLFLSSLVLVAWAMLATTARRCRDAGINPWFTCAVFIPYLAVIPWIVFGCLKTEKKDD